VQGNLKNVLFIFEKKNTVGNKIAQTEDLGKKIIKYVFAVVVHLTVLVLYEILKIYFVNLSFKNHIQ
jgi:hypothetical protein